MTHGVIALNYYLDPIREGNRLFLVPIDIWRSYGRLEERKSLPISSCEGDDRIVECPRIAGSMWDISEYVKTLR